MISFTMAYMIGIGLASGITTNPAYSAAYSSPAGAGALIVQGFSPVTDFGKFCSVVIALGLIGNTIAQTYCAGVDFQVLGRYAEKVPRVLWTTVAVVIYTVCALAGRGHLSEIFTNFLALMGYWVAIWFGILLEERYIFRRSSGYNWAAWNDPSKLPVGIAGFLAFGVGWVGAVLCMAQVWYIGPLAGLVGDYGADVCPLPTSFFGCLQTNINTDGQLCRFLLGSPSLPSTEVYRAQTIQTMNLARFSLGEGICFNNSSYSRPYEGNLIWL